jgi:hypothetical protein
LDRFNYECQSVLSASARVPDPDPSFQFNADPDPSFQFNPHLYSTYYFYADPDPGPAPSDAIYDTGLQTLQSSILSLNTSFVSVHGPGLHRIQLYTSPSLTLMLIPIQLAIMRIHIRNPGFSMSEKSEEISCLKCGI